jgi:hypothetical protein
MEPPLTTAAGLPAVRESLQLALLADPVGGPLLIDLMEAAVDHYALNYSKHPPNLLFQEVRDVRQLLIPTLTAAAAPAPGPQRHMGWLSALLGNLAFHLDDHTGARAHLGTAAAFGARSGDARLEAWAWGAQSMVARSAGRLDAAVEHAEHGVSIAPAGLVRAQLNAWALLPSLAVHGRGDEADRTLAVAMNELESAPESEAPGRFGFDAPELALHEAEANLTLGRYAPARARAQTSADACPTGTPGWAAATLVVAQAEAVDHPGDAAQRAHDVLDRVPPARLRSTARVRLSRLTAQLREHQGNRSAELAERLRALPQPIDAHGRAITA